MRLLFWLRSSVIFFLRSLPIFFIIDAGMFTFYLLILVSRVLSTRIGSLRCLFMKAQISAPVLICELASLPRNLYSKCFLRRWLSISSSPSALCSLSHLSQGRMQVP